MYMISKNMVPPISMLNMNDMVTILHNDFNDPDELKNAFINKVVNMNCITITTEL